MVEGAPLLREYTGNGIEGSNPFFSASSFTFVMGPKVFRKSCYSAEERAARSRMGTHMSRSLEARWA